ncbi:hypothetical protein DFH06DRAFT_1470413 [Mycena polygramma]|nr:hypothetical protein DFH06DRAFT_1470413 [Mycena polygramma]
MQFSAFFHDVVAELMHYLRKMFLRERPDVETQLGASLSANFARGGNQFLSDARPSRPSFVSRAYENPVPSTTRRVRRLLWATTPRRAQDIMAKIASLAQELQELANTSDEKIFTDQIQSAWNILVDMGETAEVWQRMSSAIARARVISEPDSLARRHQQFELILDDLLSMGYVILTIWERAMKLSQSNKPQERLLQKAGKAGASVGFLAGIGNIGLAVMTFIRPTLVAVTSPVSAIISGMISLSTAVEKTEDFRRRKGRLQVILQALEDALSLQHEAVAEAAAALKSVTGNGIAGEGHQMLVTNMLAGLQENYCFTPQGFDGIFNNWSMFGKYKQL